MPKEHTPIGSIDAQIGRRLIDEKLRPNCRIVLGRVPPETQFSPLGKIALSPPSAVPQARNGSLK